MKKRKGKKKESREKGRKKKEKKEKKKERKRGERWKISTAMHDQDYCWDGTGQWGIPFHGETKRPLSHGI